jgi:hypothetical protein
MMELIPSGFMQLGGDARLRLILDVWIRLHLEREWMRRFTHARATFDWHPEMGATGVRWKLMQADSDTIHYEHAISLGESGTQAVSAMVMPWAELVPHAISHGQLTFSFNEPSVGLDLFDNSNTPVFAHHLVKEEAMH